MPTFRHTRTGRRISASGRLARRYEKLDVYELEGPAAQDRFEEVQTYIESGQAAYDVKHNPQSAFKITKEDD